MHDGCLLLEELIPILDKLIHRIMCIPYTGENLVTIFGRKGGEKALTKSMKEKFKLVKKPHGYTTSKICRPIVIDIFGHYKPNPKCP